MKLRRPTQPSHLRPLVSNRKMSEIEILRQSTDLVLYALNRVLLSK